MNRQESMTNTRYKNTNDQQKKYCIGMVSLSILLEGLIVFKLLIKTFQIYAGYRNLFLIKIFGSLTCKGKFFLYTR